MAESARRVRGALESEVLAALGAAGRPLTATEVRDDLGADLAYTTIMTTLARLHDKGALTRELTGRSYAYSLAAGPDALDAAVTARRMRRLLDAGPDRAEALTRFLAGLRPEDERLLAGLLVEQDAADRHGDSTPAP